MSLPDYACITPSENFHLEPDVANNIMGQKNNEGFAILPRLIEKLMVSSPTEHPCWSKNSESALYIVHYFNEFNNLYNFIGYRYSYYILL